MSLDKQHSVQQVASLKSGDEKAFKKLYLTYYSKLMVIGSKFNLKFLSPEDFVHETFLKLYKNREKLREDIAIDRQVYIVCRSIILDYLRREKRSLPFEVIHLNTLAGDTEVSKDSEDEKRAIFKSLLEKLPAKRKEVFTLHKMEHYSYEEISEMTNLSKKTIANHIYLANKFLTEEAADFLDKKAL